MEKNKVNYLGYVLAFCVVLAGLGCFWLGTYFGEKQVETKEINKTNEKETYKEVTDEKEISKILDFIGIKSKKEINDGGYEYSLNRCLLSYNSKNYDYKDVCAEIIVYEYAQKNNMLKKIIDENQMEVDSTFEYDTITRDELDRITKMYGLDKKIMTANKDLASSKDNYLFNYPLIGGFMSNSSTGNHNVTSISKLNDKIIIKEQVSLTKKYEEQDFGFTDSDVTYKLIDNNGEYQIDSIEIIETK